MSKELSKEEELRMQLTAVAQERVAYERCANHLLATAAKLFTTKNDDKALTIRLLSEDIQVWARDASDRQDVILKKMGRR